jgi:hypothetical protein
MPETRIVPSDRQPLDPADPGWQAVVEALRRIRYGAIQLTVHDGRLVQVDVTERSRFPA